MRIELSKKMSQQDHQELINQMIAKYGSLENLHQKVNVAGCQTPQPIDDYMVWKTLATATEPDKVMINTKVLFTSSEMLMNLTPRRAELMDHIATKNPGSIRRLASELKRNYKNVYDDLAALAEFELVSFVRNGKTLKPLVNIDSLTFQLEKRA